MTDVNHIDEITMSGLINLAKSKTGTPIDDYHDQAVMAMSSIVKATFYAKQAGIDKVLVDLMTDTADAWRKLTMAAIEVREA